LSGDADILERRVGEKADCLSSLVIPSQLEDRPCLDARGRHDQRPSAALLSSREARRALGQPGELLQSMIRKSVKRFSEKIMLNQ
jgi:hypothetical protein